MEPLAAEADVAASPPADVVETYCQLAGLPVPELALRARARHELESIYQEAIRIVVPGTPEEIAALYSFPVPVMTADGACSLPDQLAPEPYSLEALLGPRCGVTTTWLARLGYVLRRVNGLIRAEWIGIYQRREHGTGLAAGVPVLAKLASLGAPSRAEFPLTPEFAAHSNNSTVGLAGRATVIADVCRHVSAGGPYYRCDGAVQSEACLPVFMPRTNLVVGIVDAEAHRPGHFTPERIAVLAAFCADLGHDLSGKP